MVVPTNEEIKSLLESDFKPSASFQDETIFPFGNLERLFADNINIYISGHDFPLSGKFQGLSAFGTHLKSSPVPALEEIIDVAKPFQRQVVQVIGGRDDEWKAVILRTTATSKKNKTWDNEMVVLFRFNGQGNVSELKVYSDTQHIYNHISSV